MYTCSPSLPRSALDAWLFPSELTEEPMGGGQTGRGVEGAGGGGEEREARMVPVGAGLGRYLQEAGELGGGREMGRYRSLCVSGESYGHPWKRHPGCLADCWGIRAHDPSPSHSGHQGAPGCAEKTRQGCCLATWDLPPPLRNQDTPFSLTPRAGRLALSRREALTWIFPDREPWFPPLFQGLSRLGTPWPKS